MVEAKVLGYDPSHVPHLFYAAQQQNRPLDLSDVEVVGERIEDVAFHHEYAFLYNEEGSIPIPMPLAKMGMKGLTYPKYDLTMCTYCSSINWLVLLAIAQAWEGKPWDDVEVLTGKVMKPTPGKKKTILIGRCILITVKGCPPSPKALVNAFHQAGIRVNPTIFEHMDKAPGIFLGKYEGRPEFEEAFFTIR